MAQQLGTCQRNGAGAYTAVAQRIRGSAPCLEMQFPFQDADKINFQYFYYWQSEGRGPILCAKHEGYLKV